MPMRRGDARAICDRCGAKRWLSELRKEWTGLKVCRDGCWDPRHPQEFVRGKADRQRVNDPRPEPADLFVYNFSTNDLIDRMTTAPTGTRAQAIDALIVELKTAGVWGKLDALYVLAAANAQAALLNWVGTSYNLTAVSAPTFTADEGYTGDGTADYLETDFNPTTATSPKFVQDSGHIGVWVLTDVSEASTDIGNVNAFIDPRVSGDTSNYRVNQASSNSPTNTTSIGHYAATRLGADIPRHFKDGALVSSATTASAAPDNSSINLLRRGGGSNYSTRQIAAAHIGQGLSAAEVSDLYDALETYLTAVGAI